MSSRQARLTMKVISKGDHWIAVVEDVADFQGGVAGASLSELYAEVEAIKHFALNVGEEVDVAVDYIYEIPGLSVEVLDTYHHLREQRDELASRHKRAAAAAVSALREAGLSVRDAAALLGLSRSRVDQLSH